MLPGFQILYTNKPQIDTIFFWFHHKIFFFGQWWLYEGSDNKWINLLMPKDQRATWSTLHTVPLLCIFYIIVKLDTKRNLEIKKL